VVKIAEGRWNFPGRSTRNRRASAGLVRSRAVTCKLVCQHDTVSHRTSQSRIIIENKTVVATARSPLSA
jgi:hypothetical protein